MFELENIGRSMELPIGTRFYFRGSLYEVAELEDDGFGHSQCAFYKSNNDDICKVMICYEDERYDRKNVYFKEVEETGKENGRISAFTEVQCAQDREKP